MTRTPPARVVIAGAAGRDFHDFNVRYRDDPATAVVAFTAAQIPGIAGRSYPPILAGHRYPRGIPIVPEDALDALCRRERVDTVVFAYSDVTHTHVMALASRALAAGADFLLLGPRTTMLPAAVPVLAVCAVRTGCGKSPIARWLGLRLRQRGLRVAVLRHPMPYGDLARQRVQRFATRADLLAAAVTTEEREEYEPHLEAGAVVWAGVDYAAILAAAAPEADVIVWDGGNNDFPLVRPDLLLVVTDALRPEQVTGWHPGETVLRMADVVVVNKVDVASPAAVDEVERRIRAVRPDIPIVHAASPVRLDDPGMVRDRRVLVVEDGPTITHGGAPHGAGFVAARAAGAAEIVDPHPHLVEPLATILRAYPHVGPVLPAIGYDAAQLRALAETIERSGADVVVAGTPVDLAAIIPDVHRPIVRARYGFAEVDEPGLGAYVDRALARVLPGWEAPQ